MMRSWQNLQALASKYHDLNIEGCFKHQPDRFESMSIHTSDLFLDYSKNRLNDTILKQLLTLAYEANLSGWIKSMFSGQPINVSENQPVLHTALRDFSYQSIKVNGQNIISKIAQQKHKMADFVEAVHSGRWRGFSGKKIKHIVNIGIGGSDVGPRMVVEALKPYRIPKIHCHFVSNVDGSVMDELMSILNPEKTLFIIASKSFTTPETMQNAYTARQWLVSTFKSESAVASHFVAISTNSEAVGAFGINQANVFNMWDWVGGRYSLWSPIGLPIALAIGWSYFDELLQGAYKMDKHFQNEPFHNNMPVMMGLIGVYNTNFLGCQSQAVLPYDERLKYLPDHLQQLEMESNGKTCRIDGKMADYQTGYILWGQTGTNGQHAFYQLLHQGTMIIPSDFILVKKPHHDLIEHHQALLANALAQSRGLMTGKTFKQAYDELVRSGQSAQKASKLAPHKMIPGNKPSNTIVLNQLTPSALGQLLALYEHKILVEGIIWEINSFDQWGVELGKQLAKPLNQALLFANNASNTYDCSTEGLLKYLQT